MYICYLVQVSLLSLLGQVVLVKMAGRSHDGDCPVPVAVDGTQDKLLCKRPTLMQHSDYFRAMFSSRMIESQADVITLQDISFPAFKWIIDHIDVKEVIFDNVSLDEAIDILDTAFILQFTKAIEDVSRHLENILSAESCYIVMRVAETHALADLYNIARWTWFNEFANVVKTRSFLQLSEEELVEYLGDDRLQQKDDEAMVFQAVITWAMANSPSAEDSQSGSRTGSVVSGMDVSGEWSSDDVTSRLASKTSTAGKVDDSDNLSNSGNSSVDSMNQDFETDALTNVAKLPESDSDAAAAAESLPLDVDTVIIHIKNKHIDHSRASLKDSALSSFESTPTGEMSCDSSVRETTDDGTSTSSSSDDSGDSQSDVSVSAAARWRDLSVSPPPVRPRSDGLDALLARLLPRCVRLREIRDWEKACGAVLRQHPATRSACEEVLHLGPAPEASTRRRECEVWVMGLEDPIVCKQNCDQKYHVARGRLDEDDTTFDQLQMTPIEVYGSLGLSVSVVGKDIFIFGGGEPGGKWQTTSWRYDCHRHTWAMLPALPSPRRSHMAVVVDDRYIMLIGGFGRYRVMLDQVTVYDTHTEEWFPGPNFPHTLYSSTACLCYGHVYVVNNRKGLERLPIDWVSSRSPPPPAWESVPGRLPFAISSMVAIDDTVYLLGQNVCSLVRYNTATRSLDTFTTFTPIVARNMPVLVRKDARTLVIVSDQQREQPMTTTEADLKDAEPPAPKKPATMKTTVIEEFDVKSKTVVRERTVKRTVNHSTVVVVPAVPNFMKH